MKSRFLISLFSLFLFVPPLFSSPPDVKMSPVEFELPKAERVVLKNGIVVYLLEDHELPLLHVSIRFKSSPSYEIVPDAFEIMGDSWRTGGTKHVSPSDFDRRLEDMATDMAVSVDHEAVGLTVTCLSKHANESLSMFWDLLFYPEFKEERISLIKEKQLEALRKQNETPAEIGRRAFRDVLYGPTHVYAQNPTLKTIKALQRRHFLRIYESLISPEGAFITAAGDFNKENFLRDLEKKFESWNPVRRPASKYDYSLRSPHSGSIFYVEKDFTQSRIIFGRVGLSRKSPEEYAFKIADYILGGGGPSRLFSEIRSRRGLAYVVGSFFVEREGPGMLGVVCQTMVPATVAAVQAIQEELRKFSEEPPMKEELEMAKEATINSFLFNFESPSAVVNNLSTVEFLGYPGDYLATYTAKISSLTVEDVFTIGKKYYSPEQMKIVVVGNSRNFQNPLSKIGTVTDIPLESLE